jgi:hypothetical protein
MERWRRHLRLSIKALIATAHRKGQIEERQEGRVFALKVASQLYAKYPDEFGVLLAEELAEAESDLAELKSSTELTPEQNKLIQDNIHDLF